MRPAGNVLTLLYTTALCGATSFPRDDAYSALKGAVAALGDYDSDHYVDIFTADHDVVIVYSGDDRTVLLNMTLPCTTGCHVVNIVAGDMNHDGLLDFVAQVRYHTGPQYLHNFVSFQTPTGGHFNKEIPSTHSQFLAVNMFGRLFIDLVATFVLPTLHDTTGITGVLENMGCKEAHEPEGCIPTFACRFGTDETRVHHCASSEVLPELAHIGLISNLSDSSTVDLDGDCRADTVLSHQTPEQKAAATAQPRTLSILRSVPHADPPFGVPPQPYVSSIAVAPEVGYITFRDVDSDGTMDMVAYFCDSSTGFQCERDGVQRYNAIMVAQNRQPGPACKNYKCCFSQIYTFPDISTAANVMKNARVSYIRGGKGWVESFKWDTAEFGGQWVYPPLPHLADYDNDRAVDLITPISVELQGKVSKQVAVFHGGAGMFTEVTGLVLMPPSSGIKMAFFYDMDDDGVPDILVQSVNKDTGRAELQGFENKVHVYTHLFFSALGLNGRCPSDCKTTPHNPSRKPYGVNMPGATHKVLFKAPEKMSSKDVYLIGTQLTHSSQMALLPPHCEWGLGDTNSYIEWYFCGFHIASVTKAFMSWPALLPNSQVVVINYPPDHPDKWKLEEVANPSRFTKWIALATAVSCVLVSIPILILRANELKDDALETLKQRPMMPL